MRAVIHERYGPPESLRLGELPAPVPGDGEVLVRVRAAAIFFGDWRIIRGQPFVVRFAFGLRRPRQPVPGIDAAGVVEAVGAGVTDLLPGDEVFGWAPGTLAEFACAPATQFVTKPSAWSFEEAAAIPEAGMTALQGLRDAGGVGPGQRVLIIGASGGVGTFAVQIAAALGAHVSAVCGTRNVDLVRSLGAADVIDYTREDLLARSDRFDVIFQGAGTASPRRLRRLLEPGGTLVLSNGQGRLAGIARILVATVLDRFVRERLVVYLTRERREDLLAMRDLVESGAVRPVIDRRFPLADVVEAFRYLEAGHTQGKVVLTI
ncbi:NAD(P)-dependent alcohol dehydrogenase [soil metagenome]